MGGGGGGDKFNFFLKQTILFHLGKRKEGVEKEDNSKRGKGTGGTGGCKQSAYPVRGE